MRKRINDGENTYSTSIYCTKANNNNRNNPLYCSFVLTNRNNFIFSQRRKNE